MLVFPSVEGTLRRSSHRYEHAVKSSFAQDGQGKFFRQSKPPTPSPVMIEFPRHGGLQTHPS